MLSIVTHSMTAAVALAISWALAPRKRGRSFDGQRQKLDGVHTGLF